MNNEQDAWAAIERRLILYMKNSDRSNPEWEKWIRQVTVHPNGCWIWVGGYTGNGYPYFVVSGHGAIAGFSGLLAIMAPYMRDQLPHGVRFRVCRQRGCVRPTHATRKGPAHTKYPWAEIRAAVEAGVTPQQIAEQYGVNYSHVNQRIRRERWVMPPGPRRNDHRDIRRMWETGAPYAEIAARFNMTPEGAGHLCRKFKRGYLAEVRDGQAET